MFRINPRRFLNVSCKEAVTHRCSVKKKNSQENTCARVFFLIKLQVFSFKFWKISKNTFSYRTLPKAASVCTFNLRSVSSGLKVNS